MSMIKRATGRIEQFTDAEGEEVQAVVEDTNKPEPQSIVVKDVLDITPVADVFLDPEASDTGDDVIAKDC